MTEGKSLSQGLRNKTYLLHWCPTLPARTERSMARWRRLSLVRDGYEHVIFHPGPRWGSRLQIPGESAWDHP